MNHIGFASTPQNKTKKQMTDVKIILQALYKVNSIQEPCNFAVDILRFEIMQTTEKNKTKNIKMLDLLMKNLNLRV